VGIALIVCFTAGKENVGNSKVKDMWSNFSEILYMIAKDVSNLFFLVYLFLLGTIESTRLKLQTKYIINILD
jgi:hypothetical protein